MARVFTLKALVDLIVNHNHDAASAAGIFGYSTEHIQRIQRTPEYRNALRIAQRDQPSVVATDFDTEEIDNELGELETEIADTNTRIDNLPEPDPIPAFADSVPVRYIAINQLQEEIKQYRTSLDTPETTFVLRFYENYTNYLARTQIATNLRPTITFNPTVPVGDGELHSVLVSYTFTDASLNGKRLVEEFGIE